MMKYLKVLIIILVLFPKVGSSESPLGSVREMAPIVLGEGEHRLMRVEGLKNFSLEGNVVESRRPNEKYGASSPDLLNQFKLVAVSVGSGGLVVWKKDGTIEHRKITVERLSPDEKNVDLEKALSKLEEVEVIFSGKGVILRGEIYSVKECAQIVSILNQFPNEVYHQAHVSQSLLTQVQQDLENWLKTSGYVSQLRLEKRGEDLWIRGHIKEASEQKSIEKQVQTRFPFIHLEIDSLPDHAPTVYFRVFLLELKRSQFGRIGIDWPSQVGSAFKVTAGGIQSLLAMDLTLQQLQGTGDVKILSNPELVVRAPGEAKLFAGGKLPIKISNQFNSNVQWENYGLTLLLKVTHTAGDLVRLDIFTEVSHLDKSNGLEGVPGIQTNQMNTQVDAHFGVPLFLSGLLQQGILESARGLPFLRNIPVLGVLFGSEDYLNERSELVAILYPQSSPPASPPEKMLPSFTPKGFLPPPRDWLSPHEERVLRSAKGYPWNVLDSN